MSRRVKARCKAHQLLWVAALSYGRNSRATGSTEPLNRHRLSVRSFDLIDDGVCPEIQLHNCF